MERKDCRKCLNYYITWDKSFPYGCRKLNFKSKNMPSLDVFASSGMHCLYFEAKKKDGE